MTKPVGNICPSLSFGEPGVAKHEPLIGPNGSPLRPYPLTKHNDDDIIKIRICKKCGCVYVEV